ncbi:hypothetical protein [Nitrosomonas sp.]|uniref:hypothetical protein n=1 Tax=Nitrosomonas sp. TaxID=42353 RepID=UPI0025E1B5DD|nr:hypothetical protein [Nitrosomonas sp.]MCC6916492.1 hypothetical protein [Nitrosomonas sp.]
MLKSVEKLTESTIILTSSYGTLEAEQSGWKAVSGRYCPDAAGKQPHPGNLTHYRGTFGNPVIRDGA